MLDFVHLIFDQYIVGFAVPPTSVVLLDFSRNTLSRMNGTACGHITNRLGKKTMNKLKLTHDALTKGQKWTKNYLRACKPRWNGALG